MTLTLEELASAMNGPPIPHDTSEWLLGSQEEFPMTEEDILAEGLEIGATAAVVLWDHSHRESYEYHEPENVTYFMGPTDYLWWAQERLEHAGIVIKTIEMGSGVQA